MIIDRTTTPNRLLFDPVDWVEMLGLGLELPADEMTVAEGVDYAYALGQLAKAAKDVAKGDGTTPTPAIQERRENARRLAEGIGNFALDIIAQCPEEFRAYQEQHAGEWI